MFAAGGLLILMAMGYAVSGMISDGDPDLSGPDATGAPEPEPEETEETEGGSLADLLFGPAEGDTADDTADSDTWLDEDDGDAPGVLHLGPGDEVTGSDGEDVFAVASAQDTDAPDTADLPRISDFQSGIDRLILEFDGRAEDAPEISFDIDSMPETTIVLANGVPAALLLGTDPIQADDVEVRMIEPGTSTDPEGEVIEGTEGDDTLTGADGDDTLDGYAGDDLLDGGTGDDVLRGREGMDSLLGGGGNDAITGGPGDDTIEGGPDNDALFGNEGNDLILGGSGADEIYGDEGHDTLDGGNGTDFLVGGDGNDVISGGAQGDMLFGGDGDDLLSGDGGNDYLQGGFGADTLNGGDGNDRLDGTFAAGDSIFGPHDEDQGDVLDGGAGDDTIVVGALDIATGGEGADTFVTGSFIETAEVAGHVTDFDPAQDVIEVMFDPDLTPNPVITVEDFADGTGANILFEGQLILSVSGAQGLDPALVELREIELDLMSESA